MLENVLEVGERPAELIVYAGLGKAARSWPAYRALVAALTRLEDDQTLVVQSGKPIGVFPSHLNAPVVVSAAGNVVGRYATLEHFEHHAAQGLLMWGGLTAGAWQYIGSQGVLQGTYEVLGAVARERFGGDLSGRLVISAGLGGMGSSQPLAAKLHGAAILVADADPRKVADRYERGALDAVAADLDEALAWCRRAQADRSGFAVGLAANAAAVARQLVARGVIPDIMTDQTSAHDPLYGYLPEGVPLEEWEERRRRDPAGLASAARATMADQVRSMLTLQERGSVVFENGNNLRAQARLGGATGTEAIPGFMEAYIRPLFCRGIGPFRWVALSGDPADLAWLDDLAGSAFPERPEVGHWIDLARAHVRPQGLPARTCWLGHGERSRFALAVNQAVAAGELRAPVLFTRDHLDAASMCHPHIGTEGMTDGSDAISDWPILDALLLCSTGADLVAVHAGGGGYSGYMQSAGVTITADGTAAAADRLARGLDGDTGLGVLRHLDAGYEEAAVVAGAAGLAVVHLDDEDRTGP